MIKYFQQKFVFINRKKERTHQMERVKNLFLFFLLNSLLFIILFYGLIMIGRAKDNLVIVFKFLHRKIKIEPIH